MTNPIPLSDILAEVALIDNTTVDPTRRIAWETIPAKKAVYLLADADDQPLLLATVGNLRAALQRRLADDAPDIKTKRIPYGQIAHRVYYRIVHSPFAANLWYFNAATRLYPQTYPEMISWRPAWWIGVDPAAKFPRFRRTQDLSDSSMVYSGPIPEQAAAGKLVETLEDLFDLCRYYNILVQAPHGKACAYKEMGKCPAPCDGSVSMDHYRSQISDALHFLGTANSQDSSYHSWRQTHEAQMRAVAATQEFELAAKIKAKLERGALVQHPPYRYMQSLSQFCFLALQPGQGRPYIEPYFIHGGTIEAGPPIHKKHLPAAAAEWFTRCTRMRTEPIKPPLSKPDAQRIGLVVHHLMRGDDDAGIYLPMHQITDAQAIIATAEKLLARRIPPKPMIDQSSQNDNDGSAPDISGSETKTNDIEIKLTD